MFLYKAGGAWKASFMHVSGGLIRLKPKCGLFAGSSIKYQHVRIIKQKVQRNPSLRLPRSPSLALSIFCLTCIATLLQVLFYSFASKFLLQRMIRMQILNTNSVKCLILWSSEDSYLQVILYGKGMNCSLQVTWFACRGLRVLKTLTAGNILAGTRCLLPCCLYTTKASLTFRKHTSSSTRMPYFDATRWSPDLLNPAILLSDSEWRGQVIGTAPLPNRSDFITSSWRMVAYSMQIFIWLLLFPYTLSHESSAYLHGNFWAHPSLSDVSEQSSVSVDGRG